MKNELIAKEWAGKAVGGHHVWRCEEGEESVYRIGVVDSWGNFVTRDDDLTYRDHIAQCLLHIVDPLAFSGWTSKMAYLTGFWAGCGSLDLRGFLDAPDSTVSFIHEDEQKLERIAQLLYLKKSIELADGDYAGRRKIEYKCAQNVHDLEFIFNSSAGPDGPWRFPFIPLGWGGLFLRGLFDSCGVLNWTGIINAPEPRMAISHVSETFIEGLKSFISKRALIDILSVNKNEDKYLLYFIGLDAKCLSRYVYYGVPELADSENYIVARHFWKWRHGEIPEAKRHLIETRMYSYILKEPE